MSDLAETIVAIAESLPPSVRKVLDHAVSVCGHRELFQMVAVAAFAAGETKGWIDAKKMVETKLGGAAK